MLESLREFFDSSSFMPHGHCYLWKPTLVVLHSVSDGLIGTAYVVISATLWSLVRRIRLPFTPMFFAFGVFIGACGLTHYMEIVTLWDPRYWLSGGVKAVTAAASVATGAYLLRLRPAIVSVTRSAQLSEERRIQLETAHRELERLYARVKELDDAKTRFFANVSHELRTPLSLVLGPAERLLASPLDPAVRDDLEVIRRNARSLLRQVNELLDVARLEEGRLALAAREADLAALVRAVAAQFEALARDRGVRLEVSAPDRLMAEADPEKLERVVANLVGNAFQFVPDRGTVVVRLAPSASGVTLVVDDDGPGIAPELREAVFERFRQDPLRPRRAGGAGLGLAIARDLVALHGGTIRAEASPLGGARLAVELPRGAAQRAPPPADAPAPGLAAAGVVADLRAAAEAARPEPDGAPEPAGAPLVLVVEDNADARRFVASTLRGEFRVETAADGAEGLEKAEALRPDAVVSDLMMPRLGGEEFVRALQGRDALAGTPVLLLSARTEEALRVQLLRGGAQDYVAKPFRAEELKARVRNLVAMKRTRDVLQAELATRGTDLEALTRELARRGRELALALEATRVAREQAERAAQVKSSFLRMMSHELRTPLTTLQLGVASLASGRDGPLAERQRVSLARMDRAARRLLALIEALLEYTRVESGKLVVREEAVDLAALAADVVEDVLPQAQQKLLALTLAAPPSLPKLRTDPRLVRLALMNLVVNAVKYTERGSVEVAVGGGADGQWLEVRDTGPGIRPEDRDRIFQPFEQASAQAAGVGLGLSLVKGVVEALGGALHLDTAEGRGSRFRMELPERTAAAA